MVLNIPPFLNMPVLKMWQGCEYGRVLIEHSEYSEHYQTFKMERFAKRIVSECRRATRTFSGQGRFHETCALRQTREKKAPQANIFFS